MYLYWIRLPEHTDMLTQGYIGISQDPVTRFKQHRYGKSVVSKAIRKYPDIEMKILCISSTNYIKELEHKLRPNDKIGWNIVKGGGLPPDHSGVSRSDEFKINASERMKGNQFLVEWGRVNPQVRTEDCRAKISAALKGRKLSCEHLSNIRQKFSSVEHRLSRANKELKPLYPELYVLYLSGVKVSRPLAEKYSASRQSLKTVWKLFEDGYVSDISDSVAGEDNSSMNMDNTA